MSIEDYNLIHDNDDDSSSGSESPTSSRSSSPDLIWILDLVDGGASDISTFTQEDEGFTGDWKAFRQSVDVDSLFEDGEEDKGPPPCRPSTPDVDWILEVIGEGGPCSPEASRENKDGVCWKPLPLLAPSDEMGRKRNFDGNNDLEREGVWRTFSDLGVPKEYRPETDLPALGVEEAEPTSSISGIKVDNKAPRATEGLTDSGSRKIDSDNKVSVSQRDAGHS